MNTLQVPRSLPELHHSTLAGDQPEELGPYQLRPRASFPPVHLGYTLDRWLASFNSPSKATARGVSPSAHWHASNSDSLDESLVETALPAGSRRVPPPKLPSTIQATDADDDYWKPKVLDFYVGANQVVVRCRVCRYTGAVRDLRVDLVPLRS